MNRIVKKLEKISVGKEVINVTHIESGIIHLEAIKSYGDVEIKLLFNINFSEEIKYTSTTLVNGVEVSSSFLGDTFDLREHTETMNAGICAIQTKNARKWVGKIYPLVNSQLEDVISEIDKEVAADQEELESEAITQENEAFQEELELEELEKTLEEEYEAEEENTSEELDEDEYDALADLLDF